METAMREMQCEVTKVQCDSSRELNIRDQRAVR